MLAVERGALRLPSHMAILAALHSYIGSDTNGRVALRLYVEYDLSILQHRCGRSIVGDVTDKGEEETVSKMIQILLLLLLFLLRDQ